MSWRPSRFVPSGVTREPGRSTKQRGPRAGWTFLWSATLLRHPRAGPGASFGADEDVVAEQRDPKEAIPERRQFLMYARRVDTFIPA